MPLACWSSAARTRCSPGTRHATPADYAPGVALLGPSARRRTQRAPAPPPVVPELQALREELRAFRELAQERLDALERLAAEHQALTARVYDRLEAPQAKLAAARGASEYALAWEEDEPLVSVVIATYQGAGVLCERALPSVLAQTYGNWEAIVVGDATQDDTAERVAALGDERIRFTNLPVRGPYPEEAVARWRIAGTTPLNAACQQATGRWIAPLGHDDAFDPDHMTRLLARAREERAEFVYGQMRTLEATTAVELPYVVGRWPPQYSHIGAQAALYHRGLAAFEWDVNARFAAEPNDWQFVRRLWDAGVRFAYLEEVVTSYFYAPKDPVGQAWVASVLPEARRKAADPAPGLAE